MANFLFGATIVFIAANLVYFFTNKTYRKSKFSTALFLKLFFVLTGVLVGFAFLYYVLSLNEVVLVENIKSRKPVDPTFLNLLYFSGVTLLTIGYGDIVPIGVARFFAVLESSIGVLLPTAYFMKALVSSNRSDDDSKERTQSMLGTLFLQQSCRGIRRECTSGRWTYDTCVLS